MTLALSLPELIELTGASACRSAPLTFTGVTPVEIGGETKVSFYKGDSLKEAEKDTLSRTGLGALLVQPSFDTSSAPEKVRCILVCADPTHAMAQVAQYFHPVNLPAPGISPQAAIDPSATIDPSAHVGAFVAVGARARVGAGSVLYPQVVIYPDVTIGKQCVIHAGAILREGVVLGDYVTVQNGAVIGADGFGYYPRVVDGRPSIEKFPQVGIVTLGNGVEVGANTCIDRGALGNTSVGSGSKLDNLVQVGHNVRIGALSILCGQVGVAGSSTIGNGVTLGGGAGVKDHVRIGDGARVAARSGVTADIPAKIDVAGFPAQPAGEWKREIASLRQLPKLLKKLSKAEPDRH